MASPLEAHGICCWIIRSVFNVALFEVCLIFLLPSTLNADYCSRKLLDMIVSNVLVFSVVTFGFCAKC